MITHLQGTLARLDIAGPMAEVDVAGVRYEVLVPLFLWPELQPLAERLEAAGEGPGPDLGLHIHYSVSANQPLPVLVGFLRRAERDFFRKFVTVEGFGPTKAAKAMTISVSAIARAIEQEDRASLTRLPGVGPRAADKIIASLRGKVVAEAALQDGGIAAPVDARALEQGRLSADAAEAIAALGFSRAEARRWVEEARGADPGLETVEELTLAVLRARGAG
jgi:Holliday junction DNA helicase RuvA